MTHQHNAQLTPHCQKCRTCAPGSDFHVGHHLTLQRPGLVNPRTHQNQGAIHLWVATYSLGTTAIEYGWLSSFCGISHGPGIFEGHKYQPWSFWVLLGKSPSQSMSQDHCEHKMGGALHMQVTAFLRKDENQPGCTSWLCGHLPGLFILMWNKSDHVWEWLGHNLTIEGSFHSLPFKSR